MNAKDLSLDELFLETYPQLVSMAKRHKPRGAEDLVAQLYTVLRKKQVEGKLPSFEHVGGFVAFMGKRLNWMSRRDKDWDKRETGELTDDDPEQDRAPDLPSLTELIDELRHYSGPKPVRASNRVPVWTALEPDAAREATIALLMEAFRSNQRARAEGLIPLFRQILDPVWDATFQKDFAKQHPVTKHLDQGLDLALRARLVRLPLTTKRDELQKALEIEGLDYIPKAMRAVHRALFDLKEQFIVNYLTAYQYFAALEGAERALAQALILHHIDGLSHDQVAAQMGISQKQARTLADQGLSDLRRLFAVTSKTKELKS